MAKDNGKRYFERRLARLPKPRHTKRPVEARSRHGSDDQPEKRIPKDAEDWTRPKYRFDMRYKRWPGFQHTKYKQHEDRLYRRVQSTLKDSDGRAYRDGVYEFVGDSRSDGDSSASSLAPEYYYDPKMDDISPPIGRLMRRKGDKRNPAPGFLVEWKKLRTKNSKYVVEFRIVNGWRDGVFRMREQGVFETRGRGHMEEHDEILRRTGVYEPSSSSTLSSST